MANTDLARTQGSPPATCDYQHNSAQSQNRGRCESSAKPHFMSGIYGADATSVAPIPVSVPVPVPVPVPNATRQTTSTALEQYRLQLYNYALSIERLRCPQYGTGTGAGTGTGTATGSLVMPPWLHPYGTLQCAGGTGTGTGVGIGIGAGSNRLSALSTISLFPQTQRIFQPEEPKPQHSYIGLIAMAILSSSEIKLVLSDIYQYILDNYAYFRTRGPGWRNSIRHNLSLNDCFIKSGRSANGKGHYWAIHPANMDDFRKGDFRRRKAQRKVRKHMGLSVDDASTDSPSPPPLDLTTPPPLVLNSPQASLQLAALNYPYQQHYIGQFFGVGRHQHQYANQLQDYQQANQHHHHHHQHNHHIRYINSTTTTTIANLYSQTRKRQFDVASLLAPDVAEIDEEEETVITKVQVQKHELVVQQPNSGLQLDLEPEPEPEPEAEADIDVVEVEPQVQNDHSCYLSDAEEQENELEPEPEPEPEQLQLPAEHQFSGSSQHDSNSLEECPVVTTTTTTSRTTLPFAALPLPKSYVELNHVDPQLLSRYYGSYMAAAARRASLEASRAQSKSITITKTTPSPPQELLPNKL